MVSEMAACKVEGPSNYSKYCARWLFMGLGKTNLASGAPVLSAIELGTEPVYRVGSGTAL